MCAREERFGLLFFHLLGVRVSFFLFNDNTDQNKITTMKSKAKCS